MTVREALVRLGEFARDERAFQAAIAGQPELARSLMEQR